MSYNGPQNKRPTENWAKYRTPLRQVSEQLKLETGLITCTSMSVSSKRLHHLEHCIVDRISLARNKTEKRGSHSR